MLPGDGSIGCQVINGAIERASRSLNRADDEPYIVGGGDGGKRSGVVDRASGVPSKELAPLRGAPTDGDTEIEAFRIASDRCVSRTLRHSAK